ncbi:N-acetylmuramate alpha-1-phosphate uridylyltransferase MurU [Aquilutibacter rugosus]|uniref:N-acetylmuramate alpha-1-phosphate uridylyltransferase MurU n=1 Tax=Aquilutibacter rugosus TaxID=3115820 RepID=UPI002F42A12D
MQALIFAAGLGERMRPLTNHTPKPLLPVGGKPLIEWHLDNLSAMGVSDVVINISWLAEQFEPALGNGDRWGLRLHYSHEPYPPLETGGGMLNAWRLLDPTQPLLAINGDVWTDFAFGALAALEPGQLAQLVMVDNPVHNAGGDFHFNGNGVLSSEGDPRLTFAGIGRYHPELFADWSAYAEPTGRAADDLPRFKLAPLLRSAMQKGLVRGQHHAGRWTDVGTPERLAELDTQLRG